MHRIAGLTIFLLSMLVTSTASADGAMVSIFPEDVEVEQSRGDRSAFNVASLQSILFSPKRQRRAGSSLRLMKSDAMRLLKSPPGTLKGETDLGCTAVAVFFESRGEVIKGQMAVASVVLQRAMTPGRWGARPCDVVRPVQFSFMTSRYGFPSIKSEDDWEIAWARAIDVAANILANGPMPELQGADHYHANYVRPKWRLAMPRTASIGKHYFYADPDSASVPAFH